MNKENGVLSARGLKSCASHLLRARFVHDTCKALRTTDGFITNINKSKSFSTRTRLEEDSQEKVLFSIRSGAKQNEMAQSHYAQSGYGD